MAPTRQKEKLSYLGNQTDKESIELRAIINFFEDELLPKALVIGCSVKEFWHEDPALLGAYSKAYELRLKDSADEWKMKVNFTSWLNRAYIQSAIASVFSKGAHYPNKPFNLFSDEISEEQRLIDSE